MNMSQEIPEYHRRFGEVQSRFIDEPREAVGEAEAVVREAVDRIFQSVREHLEQVRSDLGDGTDTEKLRRAMQGYREVLEVIGGGDGAATAHVEPREESPRS